MGSSISTCGTQHFNRKQKTVKLKMAEKMAMDGQEEMKTNGEKTQKGYSIIQIVLGAIMLAIGIKYLRPAVEEGAGTAVLSEESVVPLPKEVYPCPNGVAYYLYLRELSSLWPTWSTSCRGCPSTWLRGMGRLAAGRRAVSGSSSLALV